MFYALFDIELNENCRWNSISIGVLRRFFGGRRNYKYMLYEFFKIIIFFRDIFFIKIDIFCY